MTTFRRAVATLESKRHDRHDVLNEMRELNDRAVAQERDLTGAESREYRKLERRYTDLSAEIDALEGEVGSPRMTRAVAWGIGDEARDTGVRGPLLAPGDSLTGDFEARALPTHLTSGEAGDLDLGKLLRGWVTGRWDRDSEAERRALSEGTNSAGGFLTPELLSTRVIDRVRKRARVLEAGAQTMLLDSDAVSLPRLATGITGNWRAENAAITEENPTFERVTFQPKSLMTQVRVSWELWDDMVNGGAQLIINELISGLALEVDRAALRGSGAGNQPTGVRNQSGVTVTTVGAGNGADLTSNYSALMAALTNLLAANIEPNAVIYSPRTAQALAAFADSTGQWLGAPPPLAGLKWLATSQVPTNLTTGTSNVTTEVYLGDWTNLVIGVKPYLALQMQTANGFTGRADERTLPANVGRFDQLHADQAQTTLIAGIRADVQLIHPEAFQVIAGVTN